MNTRAPLDATLAQERGLGWETKLHRRAGRDEQARFGDQFNLVCDPANVFVARERVRTTGSLGPPASMAKPASESSRSVLSGYFEERREELKSGADRPPRRASG